MMLRSRLHSCRRIVATAAVFGLCCALAVEAGGPTPENLRVIDGLIRQHGKSPFVKLILAERSGRITLDVDGRQKTGYGPPNHRFVTGTSVAQDLALMGVDIEDLPRLLVPYLDSTGPASKSGGFAVSDANLASIAEHGTVSGSDSSLNPALRTGGSLESSRTGEEGGGSRSSDLDLRVEKLERRLAELGEEHTNMLAAKVDPQLIAAKIQELARLQRELEEAKRASPNERVKAERQERLARQELEKKAYWIEQMKKAIYEVDRLRTRIRELEREEALVEDALNSYRHGSWYIDQHGVRRQNTKGYEEVAVEKNLYAVRESLSRARDDLQTAESRLRELRVEAQRDGALPEWFRSLGPRGGTSRFNDP